MAEPFKPGDVVKLKSGGPPMTVNPTSHMTTVGVLECAWFLDTEVKTAFFAEAALMACEPSKAVYHGTNAA